ncbi:MAG: hypothetical protein KAR06_08840 [Deltaproteobacteria bacterium]|nr:hypothetical protein [Deltaproteobacteria bacterium]
MYNMLNMKKTAIRTIFLLILTFVSVGCVGGSMKYVNPNANFSYIKNVAVLPFNNFSADKHAGEKVRATLAIDLMSRGDFEVMEQGEVSSVLTMVFRSAGLREGDVAAVDKETLRLIGERLGVQAVILGTVYEYSATVNSALVSISVRMIDTSSGIVLWTAKSDYSGTSIVRKIFGIEQQDKSILTRKAVRQALNTLF